MFWLLWLWSSWYFFFWLLSFCRNSPPDPDLQGFDQAELVSSQETCKNLKKNPLGAGDLSRQSEISHLSVQGFGWIWSRMNKKSAEQNSIKEFRYIGHEYIKWMQCCIAAENSTRNVFGGTWWRSPATDARIMSKVPMAFELRMQKMSLHPSILQRCLPESKNVILILAGPSIANIMQA